MLNRKTRVRSAAVVLAALQSVAAYGYAQAHDIDKYVEVLVVYGDPTVVRGADIEATITDLNADTKAPLGDRIRLSTSRRTAPSSANDYGMVSLP
ncbi:MAG: hypothetical protein E2O38_15910 [Proteobacteria bacterium]|nr:MAG: hypothetical protein E2O38_15910 [Pseudomonadota bacterium]